MLAAVGEAGEPVTGRSAMLWSLGLGLGLTGLVVDAIRGHGGRHAIQE